MERIWLSVLTYISTFARRIDIEALNPGIVLLVVSLRWCCVEASNMGNHTLQIGTYMAIASTPIQFSFKNL